jgi:hypothetical protein
VDISGCAEYISSFVWTSRWQCLMSIMAVIVENGSDTMIEHRERSGARRADLHGGC